MKFLKFLNLMILTFIVLIVRYLKMNCTLTSGNFVQIFGLRNIENYEIYLLCRQGIVVLK